MINVGIIQCVLIRHVFIEEQPAGVQGATFSGGMSINACTPLGIRGREVLRSFPTTVLRLFGGPIRARPAQEEDPPGPRRFRHRHVLSG